MSKSYWMKDQKGNFSNKQEGTFDPSKRYVGVRLQQGVPLLDRDWNELEDIRRHEEVMLRKWYIGNGTPDNGFEISATRPLSNDFKISAGRCLVDGFEAVNEKDLLYSDQTDVEKLKKPTDRVDLVYLDLWIEEVTESEDPALKNPDDVNIETCIRHKLEWRVRVAEGNKEYTKEKFHHYYDIARIKRTAENDAISNRRIQDLRKTGLALHLLKNTSGFESLTDNSVVDTLHRHSKLVASDGSPDPALSVDKTGNVGIGTSEPKNKLQIAGDLTIGVNIHRAGKIRLWQEPKNDDEYASHAIGTEAFHNVYGAGKQYVNSIGHKFYRGGGELIAQIGVGGRGKPANRMNSYFTGNVGIGTANPSEKLTISEGDLKIEGGRYRRLKIISDRHWAGIELVAREKGETGNPHIDFTHGELDSPNYGIRIYAPTNDKFVIHGGNVGIGTTDPQYKLDVNGSMKFGGFTERDSDEWPNVVWYRDTRKNWDEGLIKHSSSRGLFKRAGFGVHIHQSREWGIWSTGWTPLFGVEGRTGHTKIKGHLYVGGTKNFLIDHPLDPEHKNLIHATLEGPEVAVFYRGEAQLSNGQVTIQLPNYFEALTRDENRTVLLTPKFEGENTPISMLATSEVKDGRFTIKTIDGTNPSQKFYWEVKAVRSDVDTLDAEETKTTASEQIPDTGHSSS
ncbi:hypothetical protein B6U67_03325 [Methanosarcinales archaeon ex4484_138]|nr:MAG: hypothetical protein B6U67_03325 [Methanosarcinales archaeon ex4484_138]